ncbi:deoxyribose-phosphate aldolase [Bacteroidia bacterium]|nr:deoxyribose-phosphate aldolase [Bacteroidia bacterium]GHT52675.1 deoxyribose-phosphate aldolase [Bacteroidia bacterium]
MSKYEEALHKFNLNVQDEEISRKTAAILAKADENQTPEVLRFLYSCIDLTSLGSEDSKESIWKFVEAVNDFDGSRPDMENVAAICVYPNFVETVRETLQADVKIASVAGGFPSSQTFIEVKVAEVSLAVADGADEIDIVLNGGEFLDNNLQEVSEEISELKEACREAHLKVILETGLLKTAVNIKKAAVLAMYSGADFIKTSTGKVYPGATPEAVYVMCEAIREYYQLHNRKIGIKVSGGVRTAEEAVIYYTLVKTVLGDEWLTPEYFRIGASSLAGNLLKAL